MRWAVIAVCVAGAAAVPIPQQSGLTAKLIRVWVHSFEEDRGPIQVFRPKGYSFPRSRGRDGFEICPNGQFVQLAPGNTDGSEKSVGRWRLERGRELLITLPGTERATRLDIVRLSDEVLEVRPGGS